ncbi:phosphohistidine phosphatase SixA [Porticoccaceae bacterium]|nr:phosphohistidine phosphatase SixA [Porticoccaceae bacterium]
MKLLLMRHGDAEPGHPDRHRPLSAYGRDQITRQALAHQQEANNLQQLACSPYTRAAQTAVLFAQLTNINNIAIDWLDDLTPQGSPRAIEGFLQQTQADNLVMVSHLPLVGLLIDYLTGETGTSMGTARLASLSMDYPAQGMATLNWIHYVD